MSDDPTIENEEIALKSLEKAKIDAIDRCQYRTAARLAAEIKRAARSARKLSYYVGALHTLTNTATDLLDSEQGREAAVELIAVLESEERARQIQPDVEAEEYEYLIERVSSCAYDNLGNATALSRGYNSDGLHDVIAEGIQVCRRTGKLECITCFREYATEVFRASDDLEMALHHARHNVVHGNAGEGFDRRWAGASDEVKTLILYGRLDEAEVALARAEELAPEYHNPLRARMANRQQSATIRLLKGLEPLPIDEPEQPLHDEYPSHHLNDDLLVALRASLCGNHAEAIRILTEWDAMLTSKACLERWFEVRLRLIAALKRAGDTSRIEALARQLSAKARESRDWLTLRRLKRVLDDTGEVSPIAPVAPIIQSAAAADPPAAEQAESAAVVDSPETPLCGRLDAIETALTSSELTPKTCATILAECMSIVDPEHPTDAGRLLHLTGFLCDPPPVPGAKVWAWAEAIAQKFPNDARVQSVTAVLGNTLNTSTPEGEDLPVDPKVIDDLFRRSLDLDPEISNNFARAAVYYHNAGRINEAERCLARCVRLDRGNARTAMWLAEIYSNSNRGHDALGVLDMALRAGCDEPDVAWQASIMAHGLGQYESMLTYLDRFEELNPGQPWANYYRASGLLFLNQPDAALKAIDEEESRSKPGVLHLEVLKAIAFGEKGQLDELRAGIMRVLEIPLVSIDYLSSNGLMTLFGRLWSVAEDLPADDRVRASLVTRLLQTGLAPNEYFTPIRLANPKAKPLSIYHVLINQPLDARWPEFPGCLPGETHWTSYRNTWAVLAASEEEAAALTLEWQRRCYPIEAVVEEVAVRDTNYEDSPGMIWQGLREAEVDDEDDADPDEAD